MTDPENNPETVILARAGECRASSRVDPDGLGGSRGSRRSGATGAL